MNQPTSLSFESVYAEHRPHLARYLRPRCDHLVELEDVIQETFLQAWRIWTNRTSENVRAWLIGIARRVWGHMRRGQLIRPQAFTSEYHVNHDDRTDPENPELAIYVAQLRQHFGCLGPAQAAVMNALADGYTAAEIANDRGTSQQAVAGTIKLARTRLQQMDIAA